MGGYYESDADEWKRHERETYASPDVPGEGGTIACPWCLTWYVPRAMRIHAHQCEQRPAESERTTNDERGRCRGPGGDTPGR